MPQLDRASSGEVDVSANKKWATSTSNDGRFTCSECQRTFGRVEHLRRHLASHEAERPYRCPVCNKGFFRNDTLRRHKITHLEGHRTVKPKGARACFECAAAKVKCTATAPCARCTSRLLACQYPNEGQSAMFSDASEPPWSSPIDHYRSTQTIQSAPNEGTETPSEALGQVPAANGIPLPSIASLTEPQANSVPAVSPGDWNTDFTSINWLSQGATSETSRGLGPASLENLPSPGAVYQNSHHASATPEGQQPSLFSEDSSNGVSRRWLETVTQCPPLHTDQSSNASGAQGQSGTSRYYVDGDGARLPKVGPRSKQLLTRAPAQCHINRLQHQPTRYGFQPVVIPCREVQESLLPPGDLIDETTYERIQAQFLLLCTAHRPGIFENFESDFFPTVEDFRVLIRLYFENFQPILPIFHVPTLNLSSHHWILTLAILALGSQFLDVSGADQHSRAMQEFTRRALMILVGSHSVC